MHLYKNDLANTTLLDWAGVRSASSRLRASVPTVSTSVRALLRIGIRRTRFMSCICDPVLVLRRRVLGELIHANLVQRMIRVRTVGTETVASTHLFLLNLTAMVFASVANVDILLL